MGGLNDGGRDEGGLSWTNEALPLDVRRALLDKALEDLRRARASDDQRQGGVPKPERGRQRKPDGDSNHAKDKPSS